MRILLKLGESPIIAGWRRGIVHSRSRPVTGLSGCGSAFGKVVDQQGAIVPGVTVTISSPAITAGQMTGTTDTRCRAS
jgi:hypothetical protein